jgi:hypothetical protein
MRFMQNDEHLLLMNLGTGMLYDSNKLVVSERERLREVGIQTAIEYPEWGEIEPTQGNYNFGVIDHILDMNRHVGMKTIFGFPGPYLPAWIPNDWRFRYANGTYNTASVSIWNKEAEQYYVHFE